MCVCVCIHAIVIRQANRNFSAPYCNLWAVCFYHNSMNHRSPNSFARGPLLASKISTDPHKLANVNVECPDDRDPNLEIYISELT